MLWFVQLEPPAVFRFTMTARTPSEELLPVLRGSLSYFDANLVTPINEDEIRGVPAVPLANHMRVRSEPACQT